MISTASGLKGRLFISKGLKWTVKLSSLHLGLGGLGVVWWSVTCAEYVYNLFFRELWSERTPVSSLSFQEHAVPRPYSPGFSEHTHTEISWLVKFLQHSLQLWRPSWLLIRRKSQRENSEKGLVKLGSSFSSDLLFLGLGLKCILKWIVFIFVLNTSFWGKSLIFPHFE